MKLKILLFMLTLLFVLACWLISFDSNNTLNVFGYKVVSMDQWVLTSISVTVCFWSAYFFYKNYEEMLIESDLLGISLKLNTFASFFLASRYMFGGFHADPFFWILSFAVAFSAMFVLYNITLEGDNDGDDEDDGDGLVLRAGILSDL